MEHYVGYLRVSTTKQGEGVSLTEQKDAILSYAQKNGFKITRLYEEQVTAATQGRGEFKKMMQYLCTGKATGVVIHKIDRSARNLSDWSEFSSLIDQGIDIRFVSGDLHLSDRSSRLSADLQAVIAADYIRNLREETRKGFYGRLKQGYYPLAAPLGYVDNGGGQLKTIHPQKGKLVKKAFDLYATGRYSIVNLTHEMFALGLRSRNGGKVGKNHLWTILKNPFYTGVIRISTTDELFEGKHKPLITASLFKRVQGIMSSKAVRAITRHNFVFKRMFKCGYCQYSLIGEKQKGTVYYRCQTKQCKTKSIRESIIESALKQKISWFNFSDEEANNIKRFISARLNNKTQDQTDLINSLEKQLDTIGARNSRLDNALLDGVFNSEQYKEKKGSLVEEKALVSEKLEEIKAKNDLFRYTVQKNLERLISLYSSYFEAEIDEKRQLVKMLTSNRTVNGRNASIELKTPFRELENMLSVQSCAPYRDRPRTKHQSKKKSEMIAEVLIECSKNQIKSDRDA